MYLPAHQPTRRESGGIGNLIRHIGAALFHLHLHDVEGEVDHLEAGTGVVEFGEVAAALKNIGYPHNATLELNPDRVTPEGIRRSAAYVRACFRGIGAG